jgi:hypothetical protein
MVEIISYKMCAVKVRNAKLRNYLKVSLVKLSQLIIPAASYKKDR